jgi:hypothetical protein
MSTLHAQAQQQINQPSHSADIGSAEPLVACLSVLLSLAFADGQMLSIEQLLQELPVIVQQLSSQPAHGDIDQISCVFACPRVFADGRLLSLEQLLQELPALQQSRDASQADWTFITQEVRTCCCICW